jgi:transcriptional regulator with XRE-family HTH domain
MNFKELIKAKRKEKGLTLEQASAKMGVSKSYIWELEEGKQVNPTAKVLCALRETYGISAKRLLDFFIIQEKRA